MKKYTVLVWGLGNIDPVIRGLIKAGARNIRQTFLHPYGLDKVFAMAEVSLVFETSDAEVIDAVNKILMTVYKDNLIACWYCG